MSQTTPTLSRTASALGLVFLLSIPAWDGVTALFGPPERNPAHVAIALTALGTFCGWVFGVRIAVSARDPVGPDQPRTDESRIYYTWGCGMCLLHVAVAFHLAHAWSHAAAWEHVERLSGFGWGLYVNYLFVAVWVADVVWAWVALDSYLNRPRWVSWGIHGFMAFLVFNATVIFATDFERCPSKTCQRIFAAMLFVALARGLWKAAGARKTPEPGSRPGSHESVGLAEGHSPT